MRMQIFRMKKPSCKILKTKNCVPFKVQYTSTVIWRWKIHNLSKGNNYIPCCYLCTMASIAGTLVSNAKLKPRSSNFKGGLVRPVLEYGSWVWDHKLGITFTLLINVKMAPIADMLSFISRSKYNIHFKDALVFMSRVEHRKKFYSMCNDFYTNFCFVAM